MSNACYTRFCLIIVVLTLQVMLPFFLVINVATLWGFLKACFNFSVLGIFCTEKQIKYQCTTYERGISCRFLMASKVENPTDTDSRENSAGDYQNQRNTENCR